MNKTPETMMKRRVILADERYLIFYTFAPPEVSDSPAATQERPESENSVEEN